MIIPPGLAAILLAGLPQFSHSHMSLNITWMSLEPFGHGTLSSFYSSIQACCTPNRLGLLQCVALTLFLLYLGVYPLFFSIILTMYRITSYGLHSGGSSKYFISSAI